MITASATIIKTPIYIQYNISTVDKSKYILYKFYNKFGNRKGFCLFPKIYRISPNVYRTTDICAVFDEIDEDTKSFIDIVIYNLSCCMQQSLKQFKKNIKDSLQHINRNDIINHILTKLNDYYIYFKKFFTFKYDYPEYCFDLHKCNYGINEFTKELIIFDPLYSEVSQSKIRKQLRYLESSIEPNNKIREFECYQYFTEYDDYDCSVLNIWSYKGLNWCSNDKITPHIRKVVNLIYNHEKNKASNSSYYNRWNNR